jgi:hypothetical protein
VSDFILSLSDTSAELSQVGGKGASLARLVAAGLPVPDGFHVTKAAYEQFVAANQLETEITTALASIDPTQPAALEAAARSFLRCKDLSTGSLVRPIFGMDFPDQRNGGRVKAPVRRFPEKNSGV